MPLVGHLEILFRSKIDVISVTFSDGMLKSFWHHFGPRVGSFLAETSVSERKGRIYEKPMFYLSKINMFEGSSL